MRARSHLSSSNTICAVSPHKVHPPHLTHSSASSRLNILSVSSPHPSGLPHAPANHQLQYRQIVPTHAKPCIHPKRTKPSTQTPAFAPRTCPFRSVAAIAVPLALTAACSAGAYRPANQWDASRPSSDTTTSHRRPSTMLSEMQMGWFDWRLGPGPERLYIIMACPGLSTSLLDWISAPRRFCGQSSLFSLFL